MFRSSSLLPSSLSAALFLASSGFSGQEAPPRSAMEVLAAEECQPVRDQGIPAKARTALEGLKDKLGPWLLGRLRTYGGRSPAQVEGALAEELEALAADLPNPEGSFWHPLDFLVEAPDGHPDLLTVTVTIGIDATLLVFRKSEGGWRLIFQDRAHAYDDIDGLLGDYTTALTPENADGSFFLAAARITPWYQSSWREAELRVFRLTPDGRAQRIGARKEAVFLGVDQPLQLQAEGVDRLLFGIQGASSDPSRHDMPRTLHLWMSPAGLHRVPPMADNALDFADEWLQLPWAEAAAFTEPAARARLKPLHKLLGDGENNLLTFAEEVHHSSDSATWEVEADLERDDVIETYRFRVGQAIDGLRLLDIQRLRP